MNRDFHIQMLTYLFYHDKGKLRQITQIHNHIIISMLQNHLYDHTCLNACRKQRKVVMNDSII